MTKSLFITFEGGEGSGKTTQSRRLAQYFESQKRDVICTREIGGTKVSEKIRDIVVNEDMYIKTELLLALAARVEHYQNVIKPALADDKIVICDRFIDSSLAYQGCELGIDYVLDIHKTIFGDLMPDITFLIDVPAKIGIDRAKARGDNNRFESMPIEFHEQIRSTFLTIQNKFSDRIARIDGNRSEDEIFDEIIGRLKNEIPI